MKYTKEYFGLDILKQGIGFYLFKGQIIPITPTYGKFTYYTYTGNDIELLDFVNFTVTLTKGDIIYYSYHIGDFDCANSYKFCIRKKDGKNQYKHILGVVNVELNHPEYFCAAYIMQQIEQIFSSYL